MSMFKVCYGSHSKRSICYYTFPFNPWTTFYLILYPIKNENGGLTKSAQIGAQKLATIQRRFQFMKADDTKTSPRSAYPMALARLARSQNISSWDSTLPGKTACYITIKPIVV